LVGQGAIKGSIYALRITPGAMDPIPLTHGSEVVKYGPPE
jgi:hypothetical protein